MRHRETDFAALIVVAPAFDAHRDELGGAFAVTDYRLRELGRDRGDRIAECQELRAARIGDFIHRRFAARDQHERVVGRSVAIDGNTVERLLRGVRDGGFDERQADARVGRNEAEHGRHVGMYHARALGDAGDRHRRLADLHSPGSGFRQRVGRHDGLRRTKPVVLAQIFDASWQTRGDAPDRQRLHDDAS